MRHCNPPSNKKGHPDKPDGYVSDHYLIKSQHPEGIVAYFWPPDTSKVYPHAILIIDYDSINDEFYVADSAILNTGRISLNDSYISKNYSKPVWKWLNTLYFIKL